MGFDYRTRHNHAMRSLLIALLFVVSPFAQAWNAAGHRLAASIAWQQLSPASQEFVGAALARHPDHARWAEKARSASAADIFAEAATWPDDIRNDPRFHDEGRETAAAPLPGFPDMARHKRWHYVDLDHQGKVGDGEVDRQIERLDRLLRSTAKNDQISFLLPWLLHLVADIHQPLHVGRHGDEGGNAVEIENPFNKRLPFSSLHLYWDDLPGPPWLRGKALEKRMRHLIDTYPPPVPGNVAHWRDESHALLAVAYPEMDGSLLPIITDEFNRQAHDIANRRIVAAGYRLGWLLETAITARVSRETQ
jgi:hypothetical protein